MVLFQLNLLLKTTVFWLKINELEIIMRKNTKTNCALGVDIGGTFTDLALLEKNTGALTI